jgi:hypothetical protein
MKAQPAPLATAILAPAPLTVLVTCNGGATNQVQGHEVQSIHKQVLGFLTAIKAGGKWKVQVRTNENAMKRRNLEPGELKITGSINRQQTSASIRTTEGEIRDLIIVGPLNSEEVITRSEIFPNRTYPGTGEPSAGKVINMPPPIETENVILFLSVIISEGGTVLVKNLPELTNDLGGDNLVEHCLKEGLLQKNGSAAYSITSDGEAFVPTSIEQPPAQQKVSVRISDILEQVTAARETLAERDELAKQLETLTSTQKKHEAEKSESEKRRVNLQRQLDETQRQMTGVLSTIDQHRREILAVEATMREVTEQLRSHRFTEAASVIGDLQELQDALK